jgi:hypothetical protein
VSSNWYFTKNGKDRLGPFTFEQLRQLAAGGLLAPANLVLEDGSRKWTPAGSIQGLFPPPPQMSAARPSMPVDAEEQPVQATEEPDHVRRTRQRMFWLALTIVGGLVLLAVPVAFLASLDLETLVVIGGVVFLLLLAAAVVGGVVGLVSVLIGGLAACPECKKWWARVLIGRRVIEVEKCYGLVTRTAYTSTSGSVSLSGNDWRCGSTGHQTYSGSTHSSGSTSWQERVPVIRTTFLLTYECKFCHARWAEEKVEQVEDFDIDR